MPQVEGAMPEEESKSELTNNNTPDVPAPASEYKLRDLLCPLQMRNNFSDAEEKTMREIARELNKSLTNGTSTPKMLSIFKGLHPVDEEESKEKERIEMMTEQELLNAILSRLHLMMSQREAQQEVVKGGSRNQKAAIQNQICIVNQQIKLATDSLNVGSNLEENDPQIMV